jgi:hypothetical protein
MADRMTCRTFPTAFKLAAIKRLMAPNYGDTLLFP